LAAVNGDQSGKGFIAGIEKSLGNRLEGDPGLGGLDVAILGFSEKPYRKVFLKLLCLNTEIRLGCAEVLRRGPESLVLQNCQQVLEVSKFCPTVHNASLLGMARERTKANENRAKAER
jgi:hypothetical protein